MRADPLRSQISGCELPWEVTYLVAYSILPFGNDLITMTLTGRQIKDLLEQQFDNPNPGKNRVLQIYQGFFLCLEQERSSGQPGGYGFHKDQWQALKSRWVLSRHHQQLPGRGRR